MTKQIKEYLAYIEDYFSREHTPAENAAECALLLQRIALYQHERLIHLLVTLAFGVFFLLALLIYMLNGGMALLVLAALFLLLLVPYIKHYFFLENSVQKLYTYYYKIEK